MNIEADLGGDRLSTGERQVIQRAALSGALLEHMESMWLAGEPINVSDYVMLCNSQRRLFELIGLQRRSRDVTPDLESYLAQKTNHEPPVGDSEANDGTSST